MFAFVSAVGIWCIYVYMCMYTHIRSFVCMYVRVRVDVSECECVRVCVYIHTSHTYVCVCVCVCVCVPLSFLLPLSLHPTLDLG